MVTAHSLKSEIVEALQLGARGYVVKPFSTQVLLKAIRMVRADGYWVDREQVSSVAQYLGDEARRRRDALVVRGTFTLSGWTRLGVLRG